MWMVRDVVDELRSLTPWDLAEPWDNVGLLVGHSARPVRRLMTCLTATAATIGEAIDCGADLIVSHHPLPFRELKRLTSETSEGAHLLRLIEAGIALVSPHTAFDSARRGINQHLAEGLGLRDIAPLVPRGDWSCEPLGSGRWGTLDPPRTHAELAARLGSYLGVQRVGVVGDAGRVVRTAAVSCGSGAELFGAACDLGCDCLVTGEARFHACLEAVARSVGLLLVGHYASERFAVEILADQLAQILPGIDVWASRSERDPIEWIETVDRTA